MNEKKRSLALITGASSGLGAEYARQLAAQEVDLILVARNAEKLQVVADETTGKYGVAADAVAADLAELDEIQ